MSEGSLAGAPHKFRPRIAQPISLFLLAKLIAYTILGLLLGAIGSVLQLTPLMRAVLLIGIGIFMLGNGLRMLKVHPIFRYFVIEPPSALTRYIRRTSKNGTSLFNPLFLGAMTVLIPCGVTQAMMAVALGTGRPAAGGGDHGFIHPGHHPGLLFGGLFCHPPGRRDGKIFHPLCSRDRDHPGPGIGQFRPQPGGSPVSFTILVNRLITDSSAPISHRRPLRP